MVCDIRKNRRDIQNKNEEVIRITDSIDRTLYSYSQNIYNLELEDDWKIHSNQIESLNKHTINMIKPLMTYLYAISENENIFIYSKPLSAYEWFLLDHFDQKRVRHPHLVVQDSLCAYCAGEMILYHTDDRYFIYLDNKSGHYLPNLDALIVAQSIFNKRLNIDKNNIILVDYDSASITYAS